MRSHAGTGIALSFLIVAVVAVVLDRPHAPLAAKPVPTPARAVATASPVAPVAAGPPPTIPPKPPAPAAPAPARPHPPRLRPEAAFTRAGPGETLADIARRVYG